VRASVENVYFDNLKVTDLLVDRYFELSLRAGNRQAFVDRLSTPAGANLYKSIKNIKQPTLLLWGLNDLLIPVENAYKFKRDLPNATLVILENSGHTPWRKIPVKV